MKQQDILSRFATETTLILQDYAEKMARDVPTENSAGDAMASIASTGIYTTLLFHLSGFLYSGEEIPVEQIREAITSIVDAAIEDSQKISEEVYNNV